MQPQTAHGPGGQESLLSLPSKEAMSTGQAQACFHYFLMKTYPGSVSQPQLFWRNTVRHSGTKAKLSTALSLTGLYSSLTFVYSVLSFPHQPTLRTTRTWEQTYSHFY